MDLHLDDLILNINHVDVDDICEDWSWILPNERKIIAVSKMGDMFLLGEQNAVYWLATDDGTLSKIATTQAEFELLLQDKENVDNWFLPLLVEKLINAGKILGPSQVYSFNKLPLIGGEYHIDNIEPTDVSVHFAVTGQICEKLKDLPDGTSVTFKLFD
jgi:hypothetical protein